MIKKNYLEWALIGIAGVLLVIFLWWHFNLGMTRYFDADEYAHMHWAAQIVAGRRPFVDFLTFFPPGFHWFLAPAFLIGWGTVQPFLTARFMMFLVFAATVAVAGLLFWEQRRKLFGALLAGAIVSFLPLPFDKYLERRPDLLATLVTLLAIWFQIQWMKHGDRGWAAVTGITYTISYLVLPKMVPNIAVGLLIAGWYVWEQYKKTNQKKPKVIIEIAKPFALGLLAPAIVFLLWTLTLGDFGAVWYSLTKLSVESNMISKYFIMMPTLFFYPNGIYYGENGYTQGLYTNHVVWVIGLLFGIWRLVTPYLTVTKEKVKGEVLIALNFFIQVAFYVQFVPLKHAQYLIPIGVFVGWYVADLVCAVWDRASKHLIAACVFIGLCLAGAVFLYNIFLSVNAVKLTWTNKDDLAKLSDLYSKIPQNEYVLDLDGRMLYARDPYYACCIPFGQFAGFLSRPLPSLPDELEKTGTKYINQGGLERVNTLSGEDQQYVWAHYAPLDGDKTILVRKDETIQK